MCILLIQEEGWKRGKAVFHQLDTSVDRKRGKGHPFEGKRSWDRFKKEGREKEIVLQQGGV